MTWQIIGTKPNPLNLKSHPTHAADTSRSRTATMKKKETDFDPDEYKGIYKDLDLNWDEEIKNLRDEWEREIILPTLSAKLMPHHRGEKKSA